VAESTDGAALLVGEAEWSSRSDLSTLRTELKRKAARLPCAQGRAVFTGTWTPAGSGRGNHFGPRDILRTCARRA
jgi:hypothetical protein